MRIKKNRYTAAQQIKYFILIVLLVTAAFPTLCTSLQTGLLDPIPLVTRSVNLVLLPIADTVTNTISVSPRFYEGAWAILLVFFVALSLNFVVRVFIAGLSAPWEPCSASWPNLHSGGLEKIKVNAQDVWHVNSTVAEVATLPGPFVPVNVSSVLPAERSARMRPSHISYSRHQRER